MAFQAKGTVYENELGVRRKECVQENRKQQGRQVVEGPEGHQRGSSLSLGLESSWGLGYSLLS